MNGASEHDRAAVVAFGASPRVAAPAGSARGLGTGWAEPDVLPEAERDYTDIASALALARALPLGGGRRIVLLSDGAENAGSALDQAAQAAADGVPIDVVPLAGVGDDDLRVDGASAPQSVWSGEPVTVLASVHAPAAGQGRVEVWVDGQRFAEKEAELPAGLSSHAFELPGLPPGFHALEIRVAGDPSLDRLPGNDALPLALTVRGQPRLLLVVPEGGDPGILEGTLGRSGAEVTVARPDGVPARLSELARYDGFVLDNVPAADLTLDQLAGLREASRGLGKGLVVVGGTASYGPGGYAGTTLEETLPVTVKVTDGRQRQRVALLLVMDKSGSMSYDPLGGEGKIELAKEAVRLAARSLTEGDQVGVLVFNDRQEWVVPGRDGRRRGVAAGDRRPDRRGSTPTAGPRSCRRSRSGSTRSATSRRTPATSSSSPTARAGRAPAKLRDAAGGRPRRPHHALDDRDRRGRRHRPAELPGRPGRRPLPLHREARGHPPGHVGGGPERRQPVDHPGQLRADPDRAEPDPGRVRAGGAAPARRLRLRRGETRRPGDPDQRPRGPGARQVAVRPRSGRRLDGRQRDRPGGRLATWPRYDEFWAATLRWALPDPENRPLRVSVEREGPEAVVSVESAGDGPSGEALGA
jgi:hypothetical protein